MRTTLNLNDALLDEGRRPAGTNGKTALIHRSLENLIARESARALAARGASLRLRPVPCRCAV